MPAHSASSVEVKVGTSSGLLRWRAYVSHPAAITARTRPFRSQPWLASRCHNVNGACTTPISWLGITSRTYSGRSGAAGSEGPAGAKFVLAMRDGLLLLDAV